MPEIGDVKENCKKESKDVNIGTSFGYSKNNVQKCSFLTNGYFGTNVDKRLADIVMDTIYENSNLRDIRDNTPVALCSLMQPIYEKYHLDDYTDDVLKEIITVFLSRVISSMHIRLSMFGSMEDATNMLFPLFASCIEVYAKNLDKVIYPKFFDDMVVVSNFVINGCKLLTSLNISENPDKKDFATEGLRVVESAYAEFERYGEKIKNGGYLFTREMLLRYADLQANVLDSMSKL